MGDRRGDEVSPPNSRLFVVGSKSLNEKDFREAFQEFGDIEEVWLVRDRNTGESKGVTYIKFAKTSQAARAVEALNGKSIGNVGRNIKVMIAASKDQGAKRDDKEREEERTTRLFVKVPRDWTNDELFDEFKKFGNIVYANVVKDKNSDQNKGFGFVKFAKFSDAAVAYEECDRNLRAVFAEPKKKMENDDSRFSGFGNNNFRDSSSSFRNNVSPSANFSSPNQSKRDNFTTLLVSCSPVLTQEELWRLFDIVPELDYCQLSEEYHQMFSSGPRPNKVMATVAYNHPKWAAYALEKLHGFEYPRGMPLLIRPHYETSSTPTFRNNFPRNDGIDRDFRNPRDAPRDSNRMDHSGGGGNSSSSPDLMKLAETLAQASTILQAAGLSPDLLANKLLPSTETVCNVKLPSVKPLENIDATCVARCFIVCSPNPPPIHILRDIFCRFGNLIDVYLLSGKNCGYAKYSTKEGAQRAIDCLHGAEICGCRVKVIEAAEQPSFHRKRARLDDEDNS